MKCPVCLSESSDDKKYCAECGAELMPPRVEAESVGMRRCTSCGMAITSNASFCAYCGKDHRMPSPITQAQEALEGAKKAPSSSLAVAALLLIVGGIISLAGLAILYNEYFGDRVSQITPQENLITVAWVISAFIGMVGGIFAAYRRYAGIALTGAVFCIIAGAPIFVVGMLPGAAALVLLVRARKEFLE